MCVWPVSERSSFCACDKRHQAHTPKLSLVAGPLITCDLSRRPVSSPFRHTSCRGSLRNRYHHRRYTRWDS